MSSTLLEQARALHEDIDELEKFCSESLIEPGHSLRERLYTDHRVKLAVQKIVEHSKELSDVYDDKLGVRKDEISTIAGMNALSIFYDRLKDIRDLHRHSEMDDFVKHASAAEAVASVEEPVVFSGPEAYGRYLDFSTFHVRALNLKQFGQTDYLNFLRIFYKFDRIEKKDKTGEYREFLQQLNDYLVGFWSRTQPLVDTPAELMKIDEEFEDAWSRGLVPGWTVADATVDSNPLFCVACQHLFAKESTFQAHLPGKKHQRAVKGLSAQQQQQVENPTAAAAAAAAATPASGAAAAAVAAGPAASTNPLKVIAHLEYRIAYMAKQPLAQKLEDTIAFVQKKLASTYEERVADLADLENEGTAVQEVAEEESDDEDKPIYNPKNLPLGWDGKPIPYWLWKLHALNLEFKCEICGNHSYWGPRNFERHFQEARHQHGMRCLKVPNTKHFQGITGIQDAYNLYDKLRKEGVLREWNPDREEELEDADGNVYSKKTYDELRRQGLI